MGNAQGKGGNAEYCKALIQGLPDALPYFEVKEHVLKPHETRGLAFSTLDWEHLERPMHANGQLLDPTPVSELKHHRPVPVPFVAGATTATFPKRPNPAHGNKLEWMSHPIADAWFLEVTDSCAFGALLDGSGPGHRGWAAAHLALVEMKNVIVERLRSKGLKTSIDVAKALQKALMSSHDLLLGVDEAQAATAALFVVVPLPGGQYGMVYAAVGDVEMYRYCQDKEAWQALMQPFADLRFKDARFKHGTEGGIGKGCGERGALRAGMNLQYGAVQLNPDDVVVLSSDGLGDVLDPLAARVPPKQFDLPHSDWHQFAKQHDMDGPTIAQEVKLKRLQGISGDLPAEVESDDVRLVVQDLVDFAMQGTEGERRLYSDPQYRDDKGRLLPDKVERARIAGLASGDFSYAKMDHLGVLAFAPKCISAAPPRPKSGQDREKDKATQVLCTAS